MDIAAQQGYQGEVRKEDRASAKIATGGSIAEGLAGAGAIALAIIGLAGIMPSYMVAIATIAVGAALLFEGGAISARINALLNSSVGKDRINVMEVGGGMSAEFVGGIAGVALGILALIGMAPMALIPIASIVFGASLVIGSGSTARLNSLSASPYEDALYKDIIRESMVAASGVQVLIGLGVMTLGILALLGYLPMTLSLVAMLCTGFADLLSGSAIGGRMAGLFRHF